MKRNLKAFLFPLHIGSVPNLNVINGDDVVDCHFYISRIFSFSSLFYFYKFYNFLPVTQSASSIWRGDVINGINRYKRKRGSECVRGSERERERIHNEQQSIWPVWYYTHTLIAPFHLSSFYLKYKLSDSNIKQM